MAELTIIQNGNSRVIPFDGQPRLDTLLIEAGISQPHPCGGRGTCGKCAVTVEGAVSAPNAAELKAGVRLSCQLVLLGDTTVILSNEVAMEQIETAVHTDNMLISPMPGKYGAAVDIGTTTVAVKVYDLTSGNVAGEAAARNPQNAVAADVMGRIEAAMAGKTALLQQQITDCVTQLLKECVKQKNLTEKIGSLVLTGNTTMLYLLTGRDSECLSHAPFEADTLFDNEIPLFDGTAYLPPCMNAFVGADITCAVLASDMCRQPETALLCDVGTNGEMALWKEGKLYVTSTAAGPAFEGAGISCGCGSVRGAIDRVEVENGVLKLHTIGDAAPVGICGSGLIDAIAAGLTIGAIDETGAMDEDELLLCEELALQPMDVRAVQLAKAAIAAGIDTLLETAGATLEEVQTLYIAGGFGSHLNVESAAAIGLIPRELAGRVEVLGNAALAGAISTLLNVQNQEELRRIVGLAKPVHLGGNPRFNENYVEHMLFED